MPLLDHSLKINEKNRETSMLLIPEKLSAQWLKCVCNKQDLAIAEIRFWTEHFPQCNAEVTGVNDSWWNY